MILVTKKNVTVELLTTLVGGSVTGSTRIPRVAKKFHLLTRRGVQTAEIMRKGVAPHIFFIKHTTNSPHATVRVGTESRYIGGSISKLVELIKKEEYDFYMRRYY